MLGRPMNLKTKQQFQKMFANYNIQVADESDLWRDFDDWIGLLSRNIYDAALDHALTSKVIILEDDDYLVVRPGVGPQ